MRLPSVAFAPRQPRGRKRATPQSGGCSVKDILLTTPPFAVERPDSSRTKALLAVRIGTGAQPRAAVDAVLALCSEMDSALAPVVGPHGVAALYRRSLFLTAQAHPALTGLHESVDSLMDLAELKTRLGTLSAEQVHVVGVALLQTFQELLESLVGSSLTERLLSSLWDRPLSDPPALEPAP